MFSLFRVQQSPFYKSTSPILSSPLENQIKCFDLHDGEQNSSLPILTISSYLRRRSNPPSYDLRLVNAEGNWLARFEGITFSLSKTGKLEIAGGVQWGPGLLDEIVISGIAMVEAERRQGISG